MASASNGTSTNGHTDAGPSRKAASSSSGERASASSLLDNGAFTAFQATQQEHDASIVAHIYQSGFQQGNYADIQLIVLNRSYRLHCLILSRSPYLDHLIRSTPTKQIYIPLEQFPHITEEAFAIALGYLYASASMNLVTPANARSVLATACLLGGMEELCAHAYELCKTTITLENAHNWVEFLSTIPFSSAPSSPRSASPLPTPNENGIPHNHHFQNGYTQWSGYTQHPPAPPPSAIFGPYAERLRGDVFHFLVVALPGQLAAAGSNVSEVLVNVYSQLPFEYFKAAIESPEFPIGNDHQRFQFAKAALAIRKQGIARDAEESVVLAFGGRDQGQSNVHITRRMAKRRLFKVGQ
ncbi:uncharacterized protein EI90DRAFT_3121610 [Cantharellus anzutake]|uniref:uncharacterized protein n=1 Tax=Cantharellus anzutake TaxID=1750568 RepID=UPI001905554B|nr:uncharacterized protein EI90DRAFT_3121610 [Cantharellus anzutake]KAF8334283.1 hypothetical protein EI90DRAFT_3121610 [Cantharellus anzutake]